eukprot:1632129-Pyramimonas_sp.AAC.1
MPKNNQGPIRRWPSCLPYSDDGPPMRMGSRVFLARFCPWMRWVYFHGGWRHSCEICQEPVDDTQHILSERHYELSVARYQDGWPDPNTFVHPGNLWCNCGGQAWGAFHRITIVRKPWPGWRPVKPP